MNDGGAEGPSSTFNMNGGIHHVPISGLPGKLWLCGKHLIAPDPEGTLLSVGATHVVCLVREYELADRYPSYVEWLRSSGSATWFPINDLSLPRLEEIRAPFQSVYSRVHGGESVIVHCAAGIGRAGSFATALCMMSGMNLDVAVAHVRRHRPGAGPEAGEQREVLEELARSLGR
ncbi:MAG: protein-tyrosine phosphatase family protein [Ilumatobacteraceae bacterium]